MLSGYFIAEIKAVIIMAAGALLVMTGCAAVGPDYIRPEIEMPAAWRSPAADKAPEPADFQSLAEWWKRLDDPLLTGLIERAVANNLEVKQAYARVKEAKFRTKTAKSSLGPAVTGSGTGSASQTGESSLSDKWNESYSAGLDASWEIDLFGGGRRSLEAADADYEASVEDLGDVLVSLAAEAAGNYVELRTYQQRQLGLEKNLKIQEDNFNLVSLKYQAGLATALEVETAALSLESIKAQIPGLRAAQAEAKNRLAVLLGEWPGELEAELAVPSPIPAGKLDLVIGVPADLLRRRPDVRQAERNLAAQTARIGEAKAELYPSLSLKGSLGYEALALSGLISPANLAASLGGVFSWKLFQSGAIRTNIDIQTTLREQALLEYQAAVLSALEEAENALTAFANEKERGESLARAAESSRRKAELALKQYEAGLSDFEQVLEAQQSLASAENSLTESRGAAALNLISLYRALGGGFSNTNTPEQVQ